MRYKTYQGLGYDNINAIAKYLGYDNQFRAQSEALGAWCASLLFPKTNISPGELYKLVSKD